MKSTKCPHCGVSKKPSEFFKNASRKNGLSILCKSCFRSYEASPERRAKRTWNTLHCRVRLQSSYRDIEVRMSRDEYLEWAIPEYTRWMAANPGKTPSIDRIDPTDHYRIGNIRVIERGENNRRASNHPNVHSPDGMAWCHGCGTYLPRENFWKCRSNFNGLQKRCKSCHSLATSKSAKRRGAPSPRDARPQGAASS